MNPIKPPCALALALALALLQSGAPARAEDAPAAAAAASAVPAGDMASHCRPPYPDGARRWGTQGKTGVRVTLDATGAVTAVDVVDSAGTTRGHRALDDAAVAALATCKYAPVRDAAGHAVPAQFVVVYRWALDGSTVVVPAGSPSLPSQDGSTNGAPLPAGWKPARIRTTDECLPTYPTAAFDAKAEGATRLSFGIDEKGQMADERFVGSAGRGPDHEALDEAAARALGSCRFDAGTDAQGRPQATRLVVEYRWKVE